MLTRLKVSGFKNLVNVDVRFGPFTCIAGINGVGKSNLFDAITFLSALADQQRLIDAALAVRNERRQATDVAGLFHHIGPFYEKQMSFEAEMIIPSQGLDDLGQAAQASATFLRYTLVLSYGSEDTAGPLGAIKINEERLVHISLGDAPKALLFPNAKKWRDSAIYNKRSGTAFISTEGEDGNRIIKLHQDGGSNGKPRPFLAANLPRTVLSATNAAESPTALLARREMQSWRLLQLEPSALRTPNSFTDPVHLASNGANMGSTLYHLAKRKSSDLGSNGEIVTHQIYTQVANRLSELIDDVRDVWVDRDERRELLTLSMVDHYGTLYAARSLSDGTLRFLALAILEQDAEAQGLLCMEEPENGIHPDRIPAMLNLLTDLAVDVQEPISAENPMRQVIINTHSPSVVSQVREDRLLVAELAEMATAQGAPFRAASFHCLPGTWGAKANPEFKPIPLGILLAYLNPVASRPATSGVLHAPNEDPKRVIDRGDVQQMVMPFESLGEQP